MIDPDLYERHFDEDNDFDLEEEFLDEFMDEDCDLGETRFLDEFYDDDLAEPEDEWEDDFCREDEFSEPGGTSALRASSPDNPRNLPCPNCREPNRLTPKDMVLGYQCNACANHAEMGY